MSATYSDVHYFQSCALFTVMMAMRSYLAGHYGSFIWWSAGSILLFRAELTLLMGLLLLLALGTRRLSLLSSLSTAIPAGIVCLGRSHGLTGTDGDRSYLFITCFVFFIRCCTHNILFKSLVLDFEFFI